jgi:ubiquinone/menaquinone biosynthesis C-methylase UbiE
MPPGGLKEESRRHFDRWSRTYERDPASRYLTRLQAEAMRSLRLRADDRLLDIGTGTGLAVRQAAPLVERAVGVDLSPAMVARARELAAGIANAEFVEGDSEQLPFADREFTAVLCTTSMHHYPDRAGAVAEMARVLAPGGRLAIGDGCTHSLAARALDWALRRYQSSHVGLLGLDELERLLAEAGLSSLGTRSLLAGGYAIWIARRPREA